MSNKFPFFIYLVGMGSFFALDIYISNAMSAGEIAGWAETKSIVSVGSVLVLLGLDQVVIRQPNSSKYTTNIYLIQTAVCFLLLFVVMSKAQFIQSPLMISLSIVSVASTTYICALFRSHDFKTQAQLATNGWKIVLTIVVIWTVNKYGNVDFPFLVFISSFAILLVVTLSNLKKLKNILYLSGSSEKHTLKHSLFGLQFLVALLTLALSIHLEQILLNGHGYEVESARYFAHAAIILPPVVFLNGYLGFLIGPYIRRDAKEAFNLYLRFRLRSIVAVLVSSIILLGGSNYVFEFIVSDEISYSLGVAFCLSLLGVLRLCYIIPSGFVYVLGTHKQINRLLIVNICGVALMVVLFSMLLALSIRPDIAIAISSLANWILRVGFGFLLVEELQHSFA